MIPITRPELPPLSAYCDVLQEVWDSRMLSNFGPIARRLERLTADYLEVPTRVVSSGDIGLMITIAAMDLPRGSVALVPSFTFNSTINAVLWNGLRPVFVDIDPDTMTMDPDDARAAADGLNVSLVVATHVFGNPADADRLAALAGDLGARLLFDAAHAYGSIRDGVKAGGLGDAEVFSLSGTKPVTSGEGGLIASRDPDLLARVDLLRGYGFLGDYNSRLVGLNGKMSELHAALGLLTMARIEEALAVRRAHIANYHARLAGIDIGYQRVRATDRSTYKDFALRFTDPDACRRVELALADAAVQTKRYFRPCHTMDAYSAYATRPLVATERANQTTLCVPLFESISDKEIGLITSTIRAVL